MQKQQPKNIELENEIVLDWDFLELILRRAEENYEDFLEEVEGEFRT